MIFVQWTVAFVQRVVPIIWERTATILKEPTLIMDTPCFHKQVKKSTFYSLYLYLMQLSLQVHGKNNGVRETVWAPQGVLQPDWPLGKTNASQPPSFTCLWVENKHYHPPARLVSGCSHTSLSLEFQWLQSACLHCNSLSNSPDQGLLRWNSLFSLCNSPNQGLLHWDSLVCIPASSQTGLWVKNDASQPPPFTGLWVEHKH